MNAPLIEKIRTGYGGFSKGQRRIIDYLTEHPEDAAFMTAKRLGEQTGVSESTVIRFAMLKGFDGYPDLQSQLQTMLESRLSTLQRAELARRIPEENAVREVLEADIRNLQKTQEMSDPVLFSEAVSWLCDGLHVYLAGSGSARPLLIFFGNYLSYLRENVILLPDSETDARAQMARVSPADVCFGISFPRYSAATADLLGFAAERGAAVIALTDRKDSPAALVADTVLLARSGMVSLADSLTAPLSLLNALLVAAANRFGAGADRSLARLEEIFEENGVYIAPDSQEAGPDASERRPAWREGQQ